MRPIHAPKSVAAALPGQRGPAELKEPEDGVEAGPEFRARLEPHDAAVDRLAGVQRVADRLEVEDDLEDDGDRRDQEDRRRVLDRRRGADQPLAAPDRRRRHDRAGPDHLEQVARVEGRAARADRRRPSGAARRDRTAAGRRPRHGARDRGVHAEARQCSGRQMYAMQSISTSELPGMPPAAAMVVRTPGSGPKRPRNISFIPA